MSKNVDKQISPQYFNITTNKTENSFINVTIHYIARHLYLHRESNLNNKLAKLKNKP